MRVHAASILKRIKAEIQAGLIKHVRAAIAGEILAELISLSKRTLMDVSDSATHAASVLMAAAFEDVIRRMGSALAGVVGRPPLQDVVIALKQKDVMKRGEPGLAQSYLKFRNDSALVR